MNTAFSYGWDDPVARFLIVSVLSFVTLSLLLLTFTIVSRGRRIRAEKRKEKLQRQAESLVSGHLFAEQADIPSTAGDHPGNTLYARMLLKTVMLLHGQYSGEYAQRLEHFYRENGLMQLSLKKLHSRKWNERLEAIRDLAEMNVTEQADAIVPFCYDRRPLVRMEALAALVRLRGFDGLKIFGTYPYPLSDWAQIHILHILKMEHSPDPPEIAVLFAAPQTSVRLLGARLAGIYGLAAYTEQVRQLLGDVSDTLMSAAIGDVLEKLGPSMFNDQTSGE